MVLVWLFLYPLSSDSLSYFSSLFLYLISSSFLRHSTLLWLFTCTDSSLDQRPHYVVSMVFPPRAHSWTDTRWIHAPIFDELGSSLFPLSYGALWLLQYFGFQFSWLRELFSLTLQPHLCENSYFRLLPYSHGTCSWLSQLTSGTWFMSWNNQFSFCYPFSDTLVLPWWLNLSLWDYFWSSVLRSTCWFRISVGPSVILCLDVCGLTTASHYQWSFLLGVLSWILWKTNLRFSIFEHLDFHSGLEYWIDNSYLSRTPLVHLVNHEFWTLFRYVRGLFKWKGGSCWRFSYAHLYF